MQGILILEFLNSKFFILPFSSVFAEAAISLYCGSNLSCQELHLLCLIQT